MTQYGSLQDPYESFLEKWLIHEAMEVYAYNSCMEQEENPRIKAICERFLDYEQSHLHLVCELLKKYERRDPAEILGGSVPKLIEFKSQRDFVRNTLAEEMDLRAKGHDYVDKKNEGHASRDYRNHLNSEGVPAEAVSAGYQWAPGTELSLKKVS